MTHLVIVESNSPELLAQGRSGSLAFCTTLLALRPDVTFTVVAPYAKDVDLATFQPADGIIFTGAGVDWATDAPEASGLRDLMYRVFEMGKPVWGSCNGLQLAAVVLGGAVGASSNGHEVGLALDINQTSEGAGHPMMVGRCAGFAVPCVHRDEVQRLPDGAVLLASNAHSQVQAMAYEKDGVDFWGVQYHPEFAASHVANMMERGLYAEHAHKADDLAIADHDPSALQRLGAPAEALDLSVRARELVNWLDHVESR